MNQILPGNAIGGSITILNRKTYLKDRATNSDHTPLKNRIS